jgi:hypothetical protein
VEIRIIAMPTPITYNTAKRAGRRLTSNTATGTCTAAFTAATCNNAQTANGDIGYGE